LRSPLQIFGGTIGSAAVVMLPWSTIPSLLVPFYLITHGIIFAKLARARRVTVAWPVCCPMCAGACRDWICL
jgi:hypothetical protein